MKRQPTRKILCALTGLLAGGVLAVPAVATTVGANALPSLSSVVCDNTCMNAPADAISTTAGLAAYQGDSASSGVVITRYGGVDASVMADPGAVIQGGGQWADELTVTGPAGTAGTTGTLAVQGAMYGNASSGADQGYIGMGLFTDASVNDYTALGGPTSVHDLGPQYQHVFSGQSTDFANPFSAAFSFTYGQPFVLGGGLALSITSTGTGGSGPTILGANQFISAIDLPAGATLISLSGSVYPVSAVPVPAAGWLFVSGLVGLVGVGRRGQRARAA